MSVTPEKAPLSAITEDYIKAIFALGKEGAVGTTDLANALDVAPASATSMTKRLAEAGLLDRLPYHGVSLTKRGRRIAVKLVRRHRLIELFLHDVLGLPWDSVHGEAEKWEHVISKEVEERIDALLGHPKHDPHGAPIPSVDLEYEEAAQIALSGLRAGREAVVQEVADDDPALLRYVGKLGLYPGVRFSVRAEAPFSGGPIKIVLAEGGTRQKIVLVDGRAATAIYVEAR